MKKRKKRSGREIEKNLDAEINQISDTVDLVLGRDGFNSKTRKFDNPSGRPAENIQTEPRTLGEVAPPCPVCGVIPHNLAIHDEWRNIPGVKSQDKIAADLRAVRSYARYPAHERVDRPALPCPACEAVDG